jgi:hypothetical protein
MSLKDRVQVEPLDDDRWGRIERGVVASLRARRPEDARARGLWRWAAAMGAAAACAAAAGVIAWRLARPGAAGARAGADTVAIATEAHGTRIELGDAVVEASPDTAFTVARPGGGVELSLARGRVELDVPHRPDRAPLVVHAGDVDVIDVGTIFSVARGDAVTVDVREGEVQVVRGGRVARVAAGQHWSEPLVARASVVPAPAPGGAGAGGSAGGGAGAGAVIAGGAPSRAHDAVIPLGGPDDLLRRQHTATAPEGAGAPSRRHGPGASHVASGGASAPGAVAGGGSNVIMDVRAAIRAEPVAPAVDVAGDDAFAAYQDMMLNGAGGTPSQGLYGMARVRFAAGRLDEAMQWLDAYLRRFTHGDETEAVLWLRVRIRCAQAIDDPCRAAAQTYLDRYPGSHRARIAELVTNTR